MCCLHNFLIDETSGRFNPSFLADTEDESNGLWRSLLNDHQQLKQAPILRAHSTRAKQSAENIRKKLIEFYNSQAGEVTWQAKMI